MSEEPRTERTILPCPPERVAELFALRARVWISEGADPQAFPSGSWSDEHDSSRMHWAVFDHGVLIAAASLAICDAKESLDEPDAYSSVEVPEGALIAAPARVVVDAAFRGEGIAQELLTIQDEAARAAGARVAVRQASPAMRRLLERRGWRYHEPAPADPRFPGVEFSVMSLEL